MTKIIFHYLGVSYVAKFFRRFHGVGEHGDMAAATTLDPQIPSHLHEILHRNIENTGIGLLSIASGRANLSQLVRSPDMKGSLNYKLLVTGLGPENLGMNNS